MCWISTFIIIISIVTMLILASLLLHHMTEGGAAQRDVWHSHELIESPSPVWGLKDQDSDCQIGINNVF